MLVLKLIGKENFAVGGTFGSPQCSVYSVATKFHRPKICENVENRSNVNFCGKNIVVVCGEPTPTVDRSKSL